MIYILLTKILFLIGIEADARADAIQIEKNRIHHGLHMLQLIVVLAPLLLWHVEWQRAWLTVVGFIFMRAGRFNIRINSLRNLPRTHLGNDWFDRLHKPLQWVEKNYRFPALTLVYFVYFFFGLVLGFVIFWY